MRKDKIDSKPPKDESDKVEVNKTKIDLPVAKDVIKSEAGPAKVAVAVRTRSSAKDGIPSEAGPARVVAVRTRTSSGILPTPPVVVSPLKERVLFGDKSTPTPFVGKDPPIKKPKKSGRTDKVLFSDKLTPTPSVGKLPPIKDKKKGRNQSKEEKVEKKGHEKEKDQTQPHPQEGNEEDEEDIHGFTTDKNEEEDPFVLKIVAEVEAKSRERNKQLNDGVVVGGKGSEINQQVVEAELQSQKEEYANQAVPKEVICSGAEFKE